MWSARYREDFAGKSSGAPLQMFIHQNFWLRVDLEVHWRGRPSGEGDVLDGEATLAGYYFHRRGRFDWREAHGFVARRRAGSLKNNVRVACLAGWVRAEHVDKADHGDQQSGHAGSGPAEAWSN